MSDFAQTGLIGTLQRLNDTHLPALEAELVELARARPIGLILPCHGPDLRRPALAHVVSELRGAAFVHEVVISLNGIDEAEFARSKELFASMPMRLTFLWNDRPDATLTNAGGKGGNVNAALRHFVEAGSCAIVATQDCDVASFRRQDLARLCFAVAHPQLDYRFAKMYYSRVTDRLYGRVSRLFVAPLLHALVRVAGHQPLLDFLLSFRYPLAGECAFPLEVATALPATPGWGLEIGQLCEVFRLLDPREVCQVDGGTGYDHKHQPAATSLVAMAAEIAAELFRQCATEGLPGTFAFRSAVAAAFRREAQLALQRSANLALINRLPFASADEREIVAAFSECLDRLAV